MILGVTGHRPQKLGGYGYAARQIVMEVAKSGLAALEPEHVISGMALGWDTAICLACLELHIPYTAAVPFEGHDALWRAEDREQLKELLAKAAKIEVVCAPGYAAWKLLSRNQWLVDNSQHILALYNGTPGGTKTCIQYATNKSLPITNAWPHMEKYL